jgi:hypothetical protein
MRDLAHDFWQELHPARQLSASWRGTSFYVAELDDGSQLRLPIRALWRMAEHALASLIVNQASFDVLDALAERLADKLGPFDIDVVAACRPSA